MRPISSCTKAVLLGLLFGVLAGCRTVRERPPGDFHDPEYLDSVRSDGDRVICRLAGSFPSEASDKEGAAALAVSALVHGIAEWFKRLGSDA